MDHLQETLLGGAGAFVGRVADFVVSVANDDDVATRNIPFVRRFVADTPEFVAPGKYRENTAELSQALDAIKAARKDGDTQAASEIIRDNKRILALRGTMKSTESRLRKLRAQRRRIQDSKLPEQVKKDRIKAINEDIDSLQKKFNKRFKDAQKAA
jgi:hypothetical protein